MLFKKHSWQSMFQKKKIILWKTSGAKQKTKKQITHLYTHSSRYEFGVEYVILNNYSNIDLGNYIRLQPKCKCFHGYFNFFSILTYITE